MMRKVMAAALAAALGSATTGMAQAAVYDLTINCTSGASTCPTTPSIGMVTTSLGTGADAGLVEVDVKLTSGATFHDTNDPSHHALAFDLLGAPAGVKITDLASPFVAVSPQSSHSVGASSLGSFEYEIDFPHETHPPVETEFSFDLGGTGVTTVAALNKLFSANAKGIVFATDVWIGPGQNGATGGYGAPFVRETGGVPEPATWAMLIVGVGMLGCALRRRGQIASPGAAA